MTAPPRWIETGLAAMLLIMVLWIVISGFTSLLYGRVRGWFGAIDPVQRRWSLLLIGLLPLTASVIATTLILAPAASLAPMHCHETVGCMAHSPTQLAAPADDWPLGLLVTLGLGIALLRLAYVFAANQRCTALLRGLTCRRDPRGFWLVDSQRPLALCAGIWRREIFLSSGLIDAMDSSEIQIILDHETAHVRHRDNLAHLLTSLLFCPISSAPALTVLRDLNIASEQIADREAASRAGPERVARTLLRTQRLGLRALLPGFSNFHPSSLEQRIYELHACRPASALSSVFMLLIVAFEVAVIAAGVDAGHHFLETALGWISELQAIG